MSFNSLIPLSADLKIRHNCCNMLVESSGHSVSVFTPQPPPEDGPVGSGPVHADLWDGCDQSVSGGSSCGDSDAAEFPKLCSAAPNLHHHSFTQERYKDDPVYTDSC